MMKLVDSNTVVTAKWIDTYNEMKFTRVRSASVQNLPPFCSHCLSSSTSCRAVVSSVSCLSLWTSTIVRFRCFSVSTKPTLRGVKETDNNENGMGEMDWTDGVKAATGVDVFNVALLKEKKDLEVPWSD